MNPYGLRFIRFVEWWLFFLLRFKKEKNKIIKLCNNIANKNLMFRQLTLAEKWKHSQKNLINLMIVRMDFQSFVGNV